MPASVTSVSSPTGCGHRTVSVDLDGETIVVNLHTSEASTCGGSDYKERLVKSAITRQIAKGLTLDQLSGKGLF
jgi:hypothetical protein